MAGGNPLTRRTLCIGVGATVAMAGLGALRYVGSEPLVRPPGGQDEENLVSRCVHCYRCIEACPEKVIVAASLDAGVLNMRTPRMEFSDCYPVSWTISATVISAPSATEACPSARLCALPGLCSCRSITHPKPRSLAWRC